MTYALVLGGGGVTGVAWETGLLQGLRESGLDLTGADVVLGTSSGALVGAQVTTGVPLDRLYERQVRDTTCDGERPPDLGPLVEFFAGRVAREGAAGARKQPSQEVLAWIGRQARSASTRTTEEARVALIRSRLPVHEWPDRALLVTAVDTGDGSLETWDRASGVPLPLAVAASCAVPWVHPPVWIGSHRYMDGGMRSATNADLVAGHDVVVILAPVGAAPACRDVLRDEVDALLDGGSRVQVVLPDDAALEAIGPNPLDPARRPQAAVAGRQQAAAVARMMAPIRNALAV